MRVDIYADGACKGNPGPGGWGALLRAAGQEKEIFGGQLATTNNRMELMAVIEALAVVTRPSEIHLHVDSQYVLKGMTEWLPNWKLRGWKTAAKQAVKNEDLWKRLDVAINSGGHSIHWHWVKGHSGHLENERADALANRGVLLAR